MTNIGISECVRNELIEPYAPMTEKKGAFVAQFKFTICIFPTGPKKICGIQMNQPGVKSEKAVKNEDVLEILKRPMPGAKKKKNKKK
jgi:hypothetical protein